MVVKGRKKDLRMALLKSYALIFRLEEDENNGVGKQVSGCILCGDGKGGREISQRLIGVQLLRYWRLLLIRPPRRRTHPKRHDKDSEKGANANTILCVLSGCP